MTLRSINISHILKLTKQFPLPQSTTNTLGFFFLHFQAPWCVSFSHTPWNLVMVYLFLFLTAEELGVPSALRRFWMTLCGVNISHIFQEIKQFSPHPSTTSTLSFFSLYFQAPWYVKYVWFFHEMYMDTQRALILLSQLKTKNFISFCLKGSLWHW